MAKIIFAIMMVWVFPRPVLAQDLTPMVLQLDVRPAPSDSLQIEAIAELDEKGCLVVRHGGQETTGCLAAGAAIARANPLGWMFITGMAIAVVYNNLDVVVHPRRALERWASVAAAIQSSELLLKTLSGVGLSLLSTAFKNESKTALEVVPPGLVTAEVLRSDRFVGPDFNSTSGGFMRNRCKEFRNSHGYPVTSRTVQESLSFVHERYVGLISKAAWPDILKGMLAGAGVSPEQFGKLPDWCKKLFTTWPPMSPG